MTDDESKLKCKVVDSSCYTLFYLSAIANRCTIDRMLKRFDLQGFENRLKDWKNLPLYQVPLGETFVEFLEASLNSLSKEIMEIAFKLKVDVFTESKTTIIGVNASFEEIRKHSPFLENLVRNEEFDEVENKEVVPHMQEIADYLQIEEDLEIEFKEEATKFAKQMNWMEENTPEDEDVLENKPKENEPQRSEQDEELRQKLIIQLYNEYLISQLAKNQIYPSEKILNLDEWKTWWWKEEVRLQMKTAEDKSEENQVKKLLSIQKNPVLKEILEKAMKKTTVKVMEHPTLQMETTKVETQLKMPNFKRKWRNPWKRCKNRLKLLKISKENLLNGKMKAVKYLEQTKMPDQK